MKVVWTDEALDDLNEIVGYVTERFPAVAPPLERCIRDTVARIRHWPQSARSTVRALRRSSDSAWPLPLQSILPRPGKHGRNPAHPPCGLLALGGAALIDQTSRTDHRGGRTLRQRRTNLLDGALGPNAGRAVYHEL